MAWYKSELGNIGQDFGTFITNLILDKIFQAFCFYIFALGYFEDEILYFEDVTNVNNLTLSVNTGFNYKLKQKEE